PPRPPPPPTLCPYTTLFRSDAAAAADGDDLANFVWIGPADVDVSDDVVRVAERRERDVVASGPQNPGADGRGPLRLFAEQVIEDRHVVGRKIPDGVDVGTNGPEVGTRRVQVVDVAELIRRHAFLHLADARVVQEV